MDKEVRGGAEQDDTWPGEGAEALVRNLLVDGETGESFPAQVLPPLSTFRNSSLEKAGRICGMDQNVYFGLGSPSHSEWAEKGGVDEQQRQRGQALVTRSTEAKHLAASCLSRTPSLFLWSPLEFGTLGQPLAQNRGGAQVSNHACPPSASPWKGWGRGCACRQPRPRSVRLTVAVATGAWWGGPDGPVPGRVP